MEDWELIIIGAGAAGLAAAIYGARSGLETLVLEERMAGGTTSDAPMVENYPGFSKIGGIELAEKLTLHCRETGAAIHELEAVKGLNLKGKKKIVETNKTTYRAKAVIIASGSHYRKLDVAGEKELRGRGVSYCGICDGPLFKNKKVMVVGGGNSSVTTTLYLSGIASKVTVVHRRSAFRAEEALVKEATSKENVEVLWNTEVKEIKGDKLLSHAVLYDKISKETREFPVEAIFVQVGEDPNSKLPRESGVEVNKEGYIKIDIFQQTNIPGVYAAGDVTNHPVKQIGTAVGQGITAALEAYCYIRRPYYRK